MASLQHHRTTTARPARECIHAPPRYGTRRANFKWPRHLKKYAQELVEKYCPGCKLPNGLNDAKGRVKPRWTLLENLMLTFLTDTADILAQQEAKKRNGCNRWLAIYDKFNEYFPGRRGAGAKNPERSLKNHWNSLRSPRRAELRAMSDPFVQEMMKGPPLPQAPPVMRALPHCPLVEQQKIEEDQFTYGFLKSRRRHEPDEILVQPAQLPSGSAELRVPSQRLEPFDAVPGPGMESQQLHTKLTVSDTLPYTSSWDTFRGDFKGHGLSSKQMGKLYRAYKDGVLSQGEEIKWNSFRGQMKGRGLTRADMSAIYNAHKAKC